MNKFLAALLSLMLLFSCALAEDLTDCAIANGTVQAVHYTDLVAPYSGTLVTFDVTLGDRVAEGDTLFTMLTTTVYATEDGVVQAIFGEAGADAAALTARYGAVAVLEPSQDMRITATTTGAYNDDDNRHIHMGEMLYFRSTRGDKEEGCGQVISVSGSSYVVDVLEGDFELGEALTLYRDDGYAAKYNVGKGTIVRRDPLLYQGSGRIAQVLVTPGQLVEAGTPLFTLTAADADVDASPAVTAPCDGVIGTVAVSAGQQVWKGQVLARLYHTEEVEVVADVDEIDLNGLSVGDTLAVKLDTLPDKVLHGTVTEISALGVTRQNAAYYTVHVSIPAQDALLGGSASVYIPQ